MAAGFIYVLINPSMPGLAKVGKTTREPALRVAELSAATGVPTPFVLACEQAVADCDAAETWVHRELERRGFRLTPSREFFNAPLHEVVRAVVQTSELTFATSPVSHDPIGPPPSPSDLAEELYDQGTAYAEGSGDFLVNPKKAVDLWEQAAALGHATSCSTLGITFRWGMHGATKNDEKALYWFGRAAALGNYTNFGDMAQIYYDNRKPDAGREHWLKFFARAAEAGYLQPFKYVYAATKYCEAVGKKEHDDFVPHSQIRPMLPELQLHIAKSLWTAGQIEEIWWRDQCVLRLERAQEYLSGIAAE